MALEQKLKEMAERLERMENLLERLVTPIAAEEARQLVSAPDDQRKAHNASVLKRAKERMRRAA